ncbi:50S ribosomal protein L25 [Candidatus Uhrbacteria bacterium]|nr:50S ribosomal protein L25 [Candidatus Uhrbacteria bacterium]
MERISLSAQKRSIFGRKTNVLREAGKVPAVVYGAGVNPEPVLVDRVAFVKAYEKAGTSGLLHLEVEGGTTYPVLIAEFALHPVSDRVDHVDFHAVDLTKEVEAKIALHFVGEAPAVKGLGGTLVAEMHELPVHALPAALVSSIDVDIAALATFTDRIRVSDLKLPEGIHVEPELAEYIVASVEEPRTEEELAALDAAVEENVESVEVVEKKKKEEEGEEGEDGTETAKDKKA